MSSALNLPTVKYVFFLSRDLCKKEKDTLKKFFCVYSYNADTVNKRTTTELFQDYDVLLLDIYNASHRQYYAENLKLIDTLKNVIRVYIGKLKEDSKEDKNEIIEQWKIDYFTKEIPTDIDDKDQLLHKVLSALLPKPKKKDWKTTAWNLLIAGLSYLIPKLFKS